MFRIFPIFFLLTSLCSSLAQAQMNSSTPQAMTGASAQNIADPSPNSPEWQLTLDVIKTKAQDLMQKNAALVSEHNYLKIEFKKLQESVRDWRFKNEELQRLLKERNGRSDQQIQTEELSQEIKVKEGSLKELKKQFVQLQANSSTMDLKARLRKLKMTETQLAQNQKTLEDSVQKSWNEQHSTDNDEELIELRQKMEQSNKHETFLEQQRAALKEKASLIDVVTEQQIKDLERKLESLRHQKEDLQNQMNGDNSQTQMKRFRDLMAKKKALQEKIKTSENLLSQLKEPAARGLGGAQQKKQILRQMIQLDNQNARLRQKIVDLREDVALLRQQVNRLERKVSHTQVVGK